jgi:hypothetical protein
MNNKMHYSIHSPSGKLWAAAWVAMTVLTSGLQAQYVSTVVSNTLNEPYGVATDPSENVYITDAINNRIAEYVPSTGALSTFAGSSGKSGTNNGTGSAARFSQPQGIVYAPGRGGLVVVDQGNQELRYVSLSGAVSNLAGTTGVYGANNGPALGGAQFAFPTGIAVGNDGATLYIADQGNNLIRVLTTNNMVTNLNVGSYQFHTPSAVAVDNNNNVWVADSDDEVICMVSNGVTQIIAGTTRVIGTNDSSAVTGAEFYLPSGLLWDSANNLLLISDTYNNTLRSLFLTNIQGVSSYYVQTVAGTPGTPGYVNGTPSVAQFDQPFGLAIDSYDSGYYVVDSVNNALRVFQLTEPPPPPTPVPNPVIGYVTFPLVNGEQSATFYQLTAPITVFNNNVDIAIEQSDGTVETYYTWGATGSVSIPTKNSSTADIFTQNDLGLQQNQVPPSVVTPLPDMTIDAISEAQGRPSSSVVTARIQFVTANPTITGNDAAAVLVSDITSNAEIFYTTDGNAPTNGAADTFGPVYSGSTISFAITSNTTLSVQALTPNFAPSGVVTVVFSPTNFSADQITFGYESGEASSQFITAPGQVFIAPVTLTLIPAGETIDTLQFDLAISNLTAPAVPITGSDALTFSSMMEQPETGTNGQTVYYPIPPAMFSGSGFTNLLFTNVDLLGVGWVERQGETNLYDTLTQSLVTYSQAHNTLFLSSTGKTIVGAFSFKVPTNAQIGQTYEIAIANPSATLDGIDTPVAVVTVTNGSMTNGPINSLKYVTVGAAQYLVGDTAPFYWFNAGDFGDGMLENNDVTEVFQTAVYKYNGPDPATKNSDYFDAMDSSDGLTNTLYTGTDTSINTMMYGDGFLGVDDVYVTYRRSLDPSLYWFNRYDTANGKVAVQTPNLLNPPFNGAVPASAPASQSAVTPASYRYITVAGDQVVSGNNHTVQVPIRVLSPDLSTNPLPITYMMLDLQVEALDGSPAITSPISFSVATNFGSPWTSMSQGANDYSAVWLNTNSGFSGTGVLGTVTVTLPSNATTNSSYLVHFGHFSATPNGIALFHPTVQDGLITAVSRTNSSWGDGIPDSWRLLWFGTVSNALSAATADPDGDGASNWAEYVAGTNPNDATSAFKFVTGSSVTSTNFTLQWASVVNKTYSVQRCMGLGMPWTTIATGIPGNGQTVQWVDTAAPSKAAFYRAIVQ